MAISQISAFTRFPRSHSRSRKQWAATLTAALLPLTLLNSHLAAADLWVGNINANFGTAGNWNPAVLPVTGDSLEFGAAGTAGTTLLDNLMTPATYTLGGITFDFGAPAYTINAANAGSGFTLAGGPGIANNSNNLQTINDNILINGANTISTAGGGAGMTLGGVLTNALNTNASTDALNFFGPHTTTLSGNSSTFGGSVNVSEGTLNLTGTLGSGTGTAASTGIFGLTVGNQTGATGVVTISGNLALRQGTGGSGAFGNVAVGSGLSTVGAIYQTAGTVVGRAGGGTSNFQLGAGGGGYGYYKLSGGSLIVSEIGISGGDGTQLFPNVGVMDITGGSFTSSAFVTIGRGVSGIGVLNVSGGATLTSGGSGGEFGMNWGGGGAVVLLNINNALVNTQNTRVVLNEAGGGTGNLTAINLGAGGILQTQRIRNFTNLGQSLGFVNFNGGTLKASVDNPAAGLLSSNGVFEGGVYVYSGGAVIDNSGFPTIPINLPFLSPNTAPATGGITSISLDSPGTGYVGAPAVTITGGGGVGATAVATINPATGSVTGITITSPGVGYDGTPVTVTLTGGTHNVAATVGSVVTNNISTGGNVSGGVTFTGTGNTTLASGVSSYTGTTNIIGGGKLTIAGAAAINSSSGINITGGSRLIQLGTVPISPTVTLTNGTVDGTQTINAVTVLSLAANTITHGNGTTAPLSIGTLTLAGNATIRTLLSSPGSTSAPIMTTTVATGGPTNSVGFAVANTSFWTSGTYHLLSYTGAVGGTGLAAFNTAAPPTVVGSFPLSIRQTASVVTTTPGFIDLKIVGDAPTWTGAVDGRWTTASIPLPKNWTLPGNVPTDFLSGDIVLFDDSATSGAAVTALNISDANVNTAVMSFNNSVLNYSISSSGGFGIASGTLVKNGTASLTINTANTFAGGTTLNAGSLILNNAAALGSGPLTLNGGSLDNTTASPITLSNIGTWGSGFTVVGTRDLTFSGAVTLTANSTVTVNAGNFTVSGPIGGAFALRKSGAGTMTLQGNNTFTGGFSVLQGTLNLATGSTVTTGTTGQINVGTQAAVNAVLRLSGGTLNANKTGRPSIAIGVTDGAGAVVMTGGSVTTPILTDEIFIGGDQTSTNSFGAWTQSAGSVTVGDWVAVGQGPSGSAVLNLSGGSMVINNDRLTIAGFLGTAALFGVANITGTGQLTASSTTNGGVNVGEFGTGVLNVSGGGSISATGFTVANVAGSNGTVNLGPGGNISANGVNLGGGTGSFNFNGGTLRANVPNANFFSGVTVTIYGGGATLNDGGNAVTVASPLQAATGGGVSATGLSVSGGGFIATPVVVVAGGDGVGATAVATIDANGNLTGIQITNPGTGYTVPPSSFTLVGGGIGNTGAVTGTASIVANNTAGGFTKSGAGTVTLTGASAYGGPTSISQGTLNFAGGVTHNIPTSAISGAGSLVVDVGTTLVSAGVTAAGTWTVSGSHSIAAGPNPAITGPNTSKVNAVPVIAHTGSGPSAVYSGVLNLANNALIVQSTSPADKTAKIDALNEAITAGSNGATWTGNGITSSTAVGDPNHLGVGVFDNAILNKATFGGTAVDTNSILTAIAHLGDANRNGIVDIQDLTIVANNWQQARNNWTAGDLNRTGLVDIQDLTIVANNWQQTSSFSLQSALLQGSNSAAVSAVPEPASLLLLTALAPMFLRRRRRSPAGSGS